MTATGQNFEVVILGAGITGLSTVYHLQRLGVQSVAVATTDEVAPVSLMTPGFVTGTPLDNYTRTAHRHGTGVASDLWRFSSQAFRALRGFCLAAKTPFKSGNRVRLLGSQAELAEATSAVQLLRSAGFSASITERDAPSNNGLAHCGEGILAVQCEPDSGGFVDPYALLATLQTHTKRTPAQLPKVELIQINRDGSVELQCADGRTVTCEILVLACHLSIGRLLPELHEALVSSADQWSEFRLSKEPPPTWLNASFTAVHGNIWGGFADNCRLVLGGARFLRPLGGFEATVAGISQAVSSYLGDFIPATFDFTPHLKPIRTMASLDIRPCDELPIVGPMFGNGRILVATGYMGAGLSLGFYSGQCLAELIANGRSDGLPRSLWPERLRSLES